MYFEVHLLYKLKWTLTEGKYERLASQQEVLWIDHGMLCNDKKPKERLYGS